MDSQKQVVTTTITTNHMFACVDVAKVSQTDVLALENTGA
jgi:hypothetical protein